MDWYPGLYLGKTAQKKKKSLIQKIESGKTPINTYLLTLPSGEANQLEIVPAWNLKFWYLRKNVPVIVGLACGKDEAMDLVQEIVQEVFQNTGDADIRSYFEK